MKKASVTFPGQTFPTFLVFQISDDHGRPSLRDRH